MILPITYDILKVKSLISIPIVVFLGTFSGCTTARVNIDQTAFESFKSRAINVSPIRLTGPRLHLTGAQAQATWLEQIDSAAADDGIEISQFYVRPGHMLATIRDHLTAKLRQGTRIRLKLDFMFSVSALHEFDSLKVFPNFALEIVNPPSPEFIAFVAATYDVKDASKVIDAVISADLPGLRQALSGSKLASALDQLPETRPTPEVLLGQVLKRVMAQTGFFKLLKLKGRLEVLASRFHDKALVVHRKIDNSTSITLGGRGWADSFAENDRQPGALYYSDLDLTFDVQATPIGGLGIPALLSQPQSDLLKSAQVYERNTLAVIASAHREIKIFTPYFAPTDRILNALAEKALNGIQVSVYTNSVRSSDIPLVPIYMYEQLSSWHQTLGPAFHFFTFVAPPGQCLHTKLTLVDGEMAVIGSGNWDFRSFLYDSDSFIAIGSAELSQKLAAALTDANYATWQEWSADELNAASEQLRRLVPPKELEGALKFLGQQTVRRQL